MLSFLKDNAAKSRHLPLILLLVANCMVGLLTYRDYGLSWDEPLFYQYADAVPYAYSIGARLSGDFDIEKAYGPSSEDHKIYGPAYLLMAKPVVQLLDLALPGGKVEAWHLVNFITFQVGVVFFYLLARRWMGAWAAFGAALLFCSQPVLWGHAWINPKDAPFMTFFLAAIWLGFRMVDQLVLGESFLHNSSSAPLPAAQRRGWHRLQRIFQILALICLALTALILAFSPGLQELLRVLVHNAYLAPGESLLGRLFAFIAANASAVSEQAYVNKGLVLFGRLRSLLVVMSILLSVCAGLFTFWLPGLQRGAAWWAEKLAPLPTRPVWWVGDQRLAGLLRITLPAAVVLGLLAAIRVLGPLAGVLVSVYFFLRAERRSLAGLVLYAALAVMVMVLTWPYLWDAPLGRMVQVIQHMANNPQILSVVFNGAEFPSNRLPITYLPVMLAITLTLPVWPLFFGGLAAAFQRLARQTSKSEATIEWRSLSTLLLWFLLMFAYVLLQRPPMYDGYRHFLFILPPVFICAGLALQWLFERFCEPGRRAWLRVLLLAVVALPGIAGLIALHPYQYTYYNALVGGTGGASHRFETDYWLTCYREIVLQVSSESPPGTTLFVHRQPSMAKTYAAEGLLIEGFDIEDDQTFPGSLLLLSSRTNVDQKVHLEAPIRYSVGRDGAVFCVVKWIP